MNKAKILRASKALWRLENAQDRFNAAVEDLSEEEFAEWMKQNKVTLEPSKAKERIKTTLETLADSLAPETTKEVQQP